MTPRQLRFVKEYLRDQNATRAMVRAGYSARTANNHCARLLADPAIKKLIKAGLADQEAAVRLAGVTMLMARVENARRDVLAARDEIVAAGRRVKKAAAIVGDLERLAAPVPAAVPAPAQPVPAGPAPTDPPTDLRPITPRPEPRAYRGDWTAPDLPEGVAFADAGRSDFDLQPYEADPLGFLSNR